MRIIKLPLRLILGGSFFLFCVFFATFTVEFVLIFGIVFSALGGALRLVYVVVIVCRTLLVVELLVHFCLTVGTVFLQSALQSVLFTAVIAEAFLPDVSGKSVTVVVFFPFSFSLPSAVGAVPRPRTAPEAHAAGTAYPVIYRHCRMTLSR